MFAKIFGSSVSPRRNVEAGVLIITQGGVFILRKGSSFSSSR
jgi:hypothetical protein